MPLLYCRKQDPLYTSNKNKARILAEKLIPAPIQVDLSNIEATPDPIAILDILLVVSSNLLEHTIIYFPNSKAAGPDSIPNKVFKLLVYSDFLDDLVQAVILLLNSELISTLFNKTATAILYKDRKDNYTLPGSYWPIVLENLLAKLVEKIVADCITSTAEACNLLPWNQIGIQKKQSIQTIIDLLTTSIQTV
jgi:hypothetical protein